MVDIRLKFTRFFEGLQSLRPLFNVVAKKICIVDQLMQSFCFPFARSLACSPAKIQLKDIRALVCKNYIFWLVHASIPFKSKGQKFMNILVVRLLVPFLSDLYEFFSRTTMRTFFPSSYFLLIPNAYCNVRICMHFNASS